MLSKEEVSDAIMVRSLSEELFSSELQLFVYMLIFLKHKTFCFSSTLLKKCCFHFLSTLCQCQEQFVFKKCQSWVIKNVSADCETKGLHDIVNGKKKTFCGFFLPFLQQPFQTTSSKNKHLESPSLNCQLSHSEQISIYSKSFLLSSAHSARTFLL